MNFTRLVLRNIERSAFRSWIILMCAALVAFFVVAATLVINGSRESMSRARARLGADIIVVPDGAREGMENAFLMGAPVSLWMPAYVTIEVAEIEGVEAVSPQLFLFTLAGATCCAVPEMFMVAYVPETDFTIKPWLLQHIPDGLKLGEAVGGSYVFVPTGYAKILIYGYTIDLRGNLDSTGTNIDQTMFFTFETADDISRLSEFQAEKIMEIPPDSVSAVMVKTNPNADTHTIAQRITSTIPDVDAVESSNLFQSQRTRLDGIFKASVALSGIIWILSILLIVLIFSIVVNERRREIGVLRALGARRWTVAQSLLAEAIVLALFGGGVGIGLALLGVSLFREAIINLIGLPFLAPTPMSIVTIIFEGLVLALLTVIPAALLPTLRISMIEPALAMRK